MSVEPEFSAMTTMELRAYTLENRDDEEALYAFLDRLHTENPNSQVYQPEDNVAEAISEYLEHKNKQA
ncbi:DUF6887 family protein [Gloeocapsopsis dulcis]|uniref:Uncharacterized protein n=1 Tax=Gloeocapsopsis dulcis AAB1 = 1H9 TaxID=1433147 RepID=A0A6N8FPP0_9CHRO|nr:hypothetical protein [Gloeocapsopsis dulcis]MUL34854.1 hypothetical protein [Gloeocapsopsis dulcis AAB1 = 1H9]WNN90078.1 hypothetical protein P0S91_02965 [Gloeocapsopsis dulcis]